MMRALALSWLLIAAAPDLSRAESRDLSRLVPSEGSEGARVEGADSRDETLVIKGARIVTVAGPEIAGGVIVIEGGKIRQVGEGLAVPEGARVVEATGKVVMPGMVDANSSIGVAGQANEDGSEITPQVRILDTVDAKSRDLRRARQSGITTLFVAPGNRNVIGGLGAVIKTVGKTRGEMTLREDAALKAVVGSAPTFGNFPPRGATATFFARRPTTRMAVAWELRKAFFDARKYREEGASPRDEGKEILLQALDRRLPVRVAAGRATDIETALRIADELGLAIAIEEAQEAHALAGPLAEKKVPVLLRPTISPAASSGDETGVARLDTFAVLRSAGVTVALLPAEVDESGSLLAMASFAVRHGARREDALRAITLVPAEILGVADRVGSIAQGKDADFVVLSGDPLDVKSRVDMVVINGKVVFDAGDKR